MIKQAPTISVIVPIYNTEKYLKKCIQSIIDQTYNQLEILLIDDGSTDKSGEICDLFATIDNRVKVIHQDNANVYTARNKGISIASGTYLSFIDADDYINPNFFSNIISQITDEDMICFGYTPVVNNSPLHSNKLIENDRYSHYKYLTVWSKLFNREFITKNNVHFLNFPLGEDILFTFNCLCLNPQIKAINNSGYHYRDNPNSISHTYYKNQQYIGQKIMKEIGNIIKNNRSNIDNELKSITYTIYKFILFYLREIAHNKYPHKEYIKEYHALVNTAFTMLRVNSIPRKIKWQKGEKWQTNFAIKLFKALKTLGLDEFVASLLLRLYG